MPPPLRVLVAGGGVAALEAVLALRALAHDHATVELLAPATDFVQRPSSVLSPFSGQAAPHVPLEGLAELGVRRHRGSLAAVDVEAHEVRTTDGGTLAYDRLFVAPGARPVEGVPGATVFRGPISAGAVEGALRAAEERALFVLPADAGWPLPIYELALMLAERAYDSGTRAEISIVTPEAAPLEMFGPRASDLVARLLGEHGIGLVPRAEPTAVADRALRVAEPVAARVRLQPARVQVHLFGQAEAVTADLNQVARGDELFDVTLEGGAVVTGNLENLEEFAHAGRVMNPFAHEHENLIA